MKPQYIDIHAHLNFPDFKGDFDDVVKRMEQESVYCINVGTDLKTSQEVVDLANKYKNMSAVVGIHPIHSSQNIIFDKDAFALLLKNPKVVAMGECGLDFYHLEGEEGQIQKNKKEQENLFRAQIDLALEFDKPLMIHCRSAYPEVLAILEEYYKKVGDKLCVNFHFFQGGKKQLKRILDMGFSVSFTGAITFGDQYDEFIKEIPLQRIMSETDSPYVAPNPFRGKRCEPVYVSYVVSKIAQIKSLDLETVKEAMITNAYRFFEIK